MILSRRIPTRLSAVTALVTAVVVLAAPLAGIEHEASVRHVACLLDGEMVDAAPLSAAELAAPEHHHSRSVVERGQDRAPGFEHGAHCLVAAWLHQQAGTSSGRTKSVPPAPAAARTVSSVPDCRTPAIALYRLAPKLSPPLA